MVKKRRNNCWLSYSVVKYRLTPTKRLKTHSTWRTISLSHGGKSKWDATRGGTQKGISQFPKTPTFYFIYSEFLNFLTPRKSSSLRFNSKFHALFSPKSPTEEANKEKRRKGRFKGIHQRSVLLEIKLKWWVMHCCSCHVSS